MTYTLTERELKLVRLLGRGGKILRNVYVPKGDGEMAEIDVMCVTGKGVFVIESKNYSGWIFGSEVRPVKRDRLYAAVRGIWDSAPDALDPPGVESLYERLLPLTRASRGRKRRHVESIERRFS